MPSRKIEQFEACCQVIAELLDSDPILSDLDRLRIEEGITRLMNALVRFERAHMPAKLGKP